MKTARFLTNSWGLLLLGCAMAIFLNNWASAGISQADDTVLGIPRRTLFWIIGGLAAVVGLLCLFGGRPSLQAACVAWLSTSMGVYVAGFLWTVGPHFAVLLGTLPDTFGVSTDTAQMIAGVLLAYLLAGSYGLMLCLWWQGRRRTESGEATSLLKISCVHCGGHIAFPPDGIGRQTACPHRGQTINLQVV